MQLRRSAAAAEQAATHYAAAGFSPAACHRLCCRGPVLRLGRRRDALGQVCRAARAVAGPHDRGKCDCRCSARSGRLAGAVDDGRRSARPGPRLYEDIGSTPWIVLTIWTPARIDAESRRGDTSSRAQRSRGRTSTSFGALGESAYASTRAADARRPPARSGRTTGSRARHRVRGGERVRRPTCSSSSSGAARGRGCSRAPGDLAGAETLAQDAVCARVADRRASAIAPGRTSLWPTCSPAQGDERAAARGGGSGRGEELLRQKGVKGARRRSSLHLDRRRSARRRRCHRRPGIASAWRTSFRAPTVERSPNGSVTAPKRAANGKEKVIAGPRSGPLQGSWRAERPRQRMLSLRS